MSMWEDFRKFAFKGNVVDLAVGVIIGASFTKIVDAMVKGIFMPVISIVKPKGSWDTWSIWKFQIGQVLAESLNFLIVAFVLYLVVTKIVQAVHKRELAAPPPPTPSELLLTEIRDLLREQRGSSGAPPA